MAAVIGVDTEGVAILEQEVRELVRRRGLDPVRERGALDRLVAEAVGDYAERANRGLLPPLADAEAATRAVVDAVAGLGPLQQYLDDPAVEEIWINSPAQVFVARDGAPELTTTILTAAQVRDLVERMLKSSGRRLDLSSPFVDAALPGGERLHVVIPDVKRVMV
jgi:pilus assembly protein CpaF